MSFNDMVKKQRDRGIKKYTNDDMQQLYDKLFSVVSSLADVQMFGGGLDWQTGDSLYRVLEKMGNGRLALVDALSILENEFGCK